ncbi:flagellar biosynthetic protein FliR [Paraburkholderia bonniea]|uniref:flagellar biosynthetic protein FliR n=1 Tax=Paraburkholderia bonniea TaxID=2152891 RepID=UPI00129184B9|nr:flagellar biosynthetic protein FliR [Paraburkholderia bonniea]
MEATIQQLQPLALAVLWPFCRIAAAFATAPVFGEAMLPWRLRALISLILALALQPMLPAAPAIDALSLAGIGAIGEQILLGAMIGCVFHLILAVLLLFGSVVSSQMGLSMAAINDPLNGQMSDALSSVMYVLFILLFFCVDGHLLLLNVLARSFTVWPVGSAAFSAQALQQLVFAIGWMFSAALALALPVVFATLVVQIGMGLLNRTAPTLNLFALGFSITTMTGLLLVTLLIPALPEHYGRMVSHVLDLYATLASASTTSGSAQS